MVKLRTEPKFRPPVTDEEYKQYKSLLQQAREHSREHKVFPTWKRAKNQAGCGRL